MVERRVRNAKVEGSSPFLSTIEHREGAARRRSRSSLPPRPRALAVAGLSLAATVSLASAGDDEFELEDLQLTLDFRAFDEMAETEARASIHREWKGRVGETEVGMALILLDANDDLNEPGDSTEAVLEYLRRTGGFDVEESWYPEGPYGYAPFASVARGPLGGLGQDEDGGSQYVLGGLLPEHGYALHLECLPAPDSRASKKIRGFLEKGIEYGGEERDEEWTDEEIVERWKRSAPDALHEDFLSDMKRPGFKKKIIVRTENYLILTNSGGGKLFGEKMEENYETIRDMFPFEEVEGRRLMPVFLFRTRDEYQDFCLKVTGSRRTNSKGHAWRDYYSTWYESPVDPVHIHEQVHQIFGNRLHLGGGGSWYQEGFAEYVETSETDRNVIARKVREGEHVPLRKFVGLASLIESEDDKSGESASGNAYKQAALLIEFLRESRFGKKKFVEWMYATGRLPRGDVDAIDAVFQRVYGKSIEGIEEEWREYCKKR